MRKDISSVITERPRSGGPREITRKAKKKFYNSFDIEEFPNKVSIGKIYNSYYCEKEFSDLINPLKRAIEKYAREGRSYDDVYGEVKKILNGNGTLQRHVLQHFHNYIDIPASDGYMYSKSITGRGYRDSKSKYSTDFWRSREGIYVNQEGNLVYVEKTNENRKQWKNFKARPKYVNGKEIVCVDGVLYWLLETIKLKNHSKGSVPLNQDYVFKISQISKKDIKKFGLN